MSKRALVFSGRGGLDFIELREGVVRIPEVSFRVREAQKIFDAQASRSKDLMAVIMSDDTTFFADPQMKSLLAAIVQAGLFDRYMKTHPYLPEFMIGNLVSDSAMKVAAGLMTFEAMVKESAALGKLMVSSEISNTQNIMNLVASQAPLQPASLISGASLIDFAAVERVTGENGETQFRVMRDLPVELRKLVAHLNENHGVETFVNVGPVSAMRGSDFRMLGCGDVESVDSIELDPMLSWFWRAMRPQALALAQ
jgi:acyl transferase domain-containing protein